MATSFFTDQDAHAHPGSFDPRVTGTSIGLPPAIAEVAEVFGAADTEEFAAFCSVFAMDVAAHLHWKEDDVFRAAEQLNAMLGQSNRTAPRRFAFGARVSSAFAGLTAREVAAAKRQAG